MCLMLYVGAERPLLAASPLGPLGLERVAHDAAPTALQDQASVYRIGVRLRADPHDATGPKRLVGCGCAFRDTDESAALGAYDGLRALLSGFLGGPREAASLLGCWSGDERLEPAVEMSLSISELTADIELFSDVIHGWPILLRVSTPTAARRALAAGDR